MYALQWINTIIVSIGVPTAVGALIFIGKKLQILDTLQSEINNHIRPDLKDVRERFATLEGKTSNVLAVNSPISLTPSGKKFLSDSGLKNFIDSHIDELYEACSNQKDLSTPYDVQQISFEFFDTYTFPETVEDRVKTLAFRQGLTFEVARRIGAIYFRNICLDRLGFKPEDLDGK